MRPAIISTVLTIAFLITTSAAQASEVRLSLLEKSTSTTTAYSLESTTLAFRQIEAANGSELPQIGKYMTSARKLVANANATATATATALADADEILYQCRIGEIDFVVVRVESNSFSSFMKLISALSGHPIQVSKIVVMTIRDGRVISKKEITHKDSSYHWVAKVLK
jgi:hypothetical protein